MKGAFGNEGALPLFDVSRDDFEVKFWLGPISLAFNYGFTRREMAKIARNPHARAKNRIAHERGVAFHGSIEDLL
jgi:hypothetical protein